MSARGEQGQPAALGVGPAAAPLEDVSLAFAALRPGSPFVQVHRARLPLAVAETLPALGALA